MFTIYIIIKRNTQGGLSSFSLWFTGWKHPYSKSKRKRLRSRDKAGMKASSFLKIGVNYKLKIVHRVLNVHYINTCTYMLLNKKLWVLLTPIFKKLDAFIPALSLLANYYFSALLFCCLQQNEQKSSNITPPVCFFLLYYIYSKHMYFWVTRFVFFIDANFQKAGRLHSCLTPARFIRLFLLYFFVFLWNPKEQE